MSFTYYKTKPIRTQPKKATKPALVRSNAMQIYYPPRIQQQAIRRKAPQEVNYVDLGSVAYNFDNIGSVTLLAQIAQGASVQQRIGKRAYYKSLLIRGIVVAGTTGTVADGAFLIVYDKRPTGALPAITDILTAISPHAFMNDNNTGRFEIIRRKDFNILGNSATPTTGQESYNVDEYIRLNKRPITFESAGTGAIGDIDSGALYLVTVGNLVAGTTAPTLTSRFRTRFTEQ